MAAAAPALRGSAGKRLQEALPSACECMERLGAPWDRLDCLSALGSARALLGAPAGAWERMGAHGDAWERLGACWE
eukprot:5596802-Pyramimonas_sp.AAC.1